MSFETYRTSLSAASPLATLPAPLRALWWAEKGDWDAAHKLVQDESSAEAAWVHAYLHRVEGDLANARYWYAQASRPPARGALAAEWQAICRTMLRDA